MEEHQMAEYMGLTTDGEMFAAPEEEIFVKYYEKNWSEIASKTYYGSENFDLGHRLRPRLVYWGFLAGTDSPLNDEQFDSVAKVAVCVELIHKSSLLLDDIIDKDTMRHGYPSFYTIYGTDKAIMFTINLLCTALKTMTEVYYRHSIGGSYYYKSMIVVVDTLYNMSLGVLMELDLEPKDFVNIHKIKEIIELETSSLIGNSLLLGYFLSEKCEESIEEMLERIGQKLGYAFQVLNDLEPFCNSQNEEHKGSLNTDISHDRKNICIPILMELMSKADAKRLTSFSDNSYIINMFNKYNIRRIMIDDIDNVILWIEDELKEHSYEVKYPNWAQEFKQFILSVITVFESRLG